MENIFLTTFYGLYKTTIFSSFHFVFLQAEKNYSFQCILKVRFAQIWSPLCKFIGVHQKMVVDSFNTHCSYNIFFIRMTYFLF